MKKKLTKEESEEMLASFLRGCREIILQDIEEEEKEKLRSIDQDECKSKPGDEQ